MKNAYNPIYSHSDDHIRRLSASRISRLRCTIVLILAVLLSSASCKKEDPITPPDLPPLTHTGEMTLGCYVNGEPWVAQVPPFQAEFRHTGGTYSIKHNRLIVFANMWTSDTNESINIAFPLDTLSYNYLNLIYLDQYYINLNNICNNLRGDYYFELDTTFGQNYVELYNIDFDKRLISGKFSFKARNKICKDTVVISDGRFDILFSIIE